MRQRRAILIDDEPIVLDVWRHVFESRGYETLLLSEPVICPIYGNSGDCTRPFPCSDIIITDYKMPKMNGIELLSEQARRGCKLSPRNKALISGFLPDGEKRVLDGLGAAYFLKPVDFEDLLRWVDECEQRMDLTQRLGIRRKEERKACSQEMTYLARKNGESETCMAVNTSDCGVCLRLGEQLVRDETVIIQPEPFTTYQTASVRWVRQAAGGGFLAGLHYCD